VFDELRLAVAGPGRRKYLSVAPGRLGRVTEERIGAPAWLARTRLEWAGMLSPRDEPGDAQKAADLLGRAFSTARELGMANVERRAAERLRR
jgi:hypothetical protein